MSKPAFDCLTRPPRPMKPRARGISVVSDEAKWLVKGFDPDIHLENNAACAVTVATAI